jgi:hypothetical protein
MNEFDFASADLKSQDFTFANPSSFLLAGQTRSGKTTFTLNVLRNIETLFANPECRHNVVYFYKDDQPAFEIFKEENIVKHWVNRLPTSEDIEKLTEGFEESGSIVVIDDFDLDVNADTANIFRNKCHHSNCVIIMLTQNIFCNQPYFREISNQVTYVIIFKNPRNAAQITCFAKQVAPGAVPGFVAEYRKATRRPHSYLLFDTHQKTKEPYRLRSRILPHEMPMVVHVRQQ